MQASWTLEEVNAAITACKNATSCGLDNVKTAGPGLNGPQLVLEIMQGVEDFQRAEAKRRVYAKANQKKEMLAKRLAKRRELNRELKATRRKLQKLQQDSFDEVQPAPSTNVLFCFFASTFIHRYLLVA